MKILLIDATASFLDFALRAEAQGHEVRVFMGPDKKGNRYPVGDGLLKKVSDWRPHTRWADLILASDNCKYMREIQTLHDTGFPVFTANEEVTRWELDRKIGQQVLEEAGIECLPYVEFSKYSDAYAYQLKNMGKRFVSKPSADVDKALSYVSKGGHDMLFMLDYWKRHNPMQCSFIFQEFCPGIEMAVGGWVGRDGFLGHFLENFEFKKLMPGEVGPNTGEMGTVMRYVTIEESKAAQELLLPLEAALIRSGYRGYVDVAFMVGTEGERKGKVNPLEFTSRHGWPLFQIQQALHPDVAGWMVDALEGKDTFKPSRDIALGIVMAIPDFPYSHHTRKEVTGYPIWGLTAENRFNWHPAEVRLGEGYNERGQKEPMMVTAGDYVGIITGTGATVEKAKDRAYKTLKDIQIPNSPIYRVDIGDRLEGQLAELQKYGYATAWEAA